MNQFEANVVNSFKQVKKDILELKDQLIRLAEGQEKLEALISEKTKNSKKVSKKKK